MKKLIPIILLILGIFIFSIPTLNNIYISKNTKKSLNNSYENIIKNKSKNIESIDENLINVDDADISLTLKSMFSNTKNNENIIGVLYIPNISIKLPILNEPTNENLMIGSSIVDSNQKMGELNYPLIGHYSKNKSVLFGSLMDIKIGSEIFLTDGSNLYKYIATDTFIVEDTRIDLIDINKYEKPTISLMTCYYSSNTGKRFFVTGNLEEVKPINEKTFNLIFN